MSVLADRCIRFTIYGYHFIYIGHNQVFFCSYKLQFRKDPILSTGVSKYELLGTARQLIHANKRIPRWRTNWQTLTDGMYGSVKWCIVSEVAFVDRRTCTWPTRHFPQKPYYFHSICPLVRTPARIGSRARAHETFITHEEKFLSANFIEDDRMITVLLVSS